MPRVKGLIWALKRACIGFRPNGRMGELTHLAVRPKPKEQKLSQVVEWMVCTQKGSITKVYLCPNLR